MSEESKSSSSSSSLNGDQIVHSTTQPALEAIDYNTDNNSRRSRIDSILFPLELSSSTFSNFHSDSQNVPPFSSGTLLSSDLLSDGKGSDDKGKGRELNESNGEGSDIDYFNSIKRRTSTEGNERTGSTYSSSSSSSSNETETETTGFYLPAGSPPLPSHIISSSSTSEKLINKSTTARKISPEVIKSRRRIPSIQGVLGFFNPPSFSPDGSLADDDSDVEERDGDGLDITEEEEEEEEEDWGRKFSKEEAWYFLRALVGEELRRENKELWKLKSLDLNDETSSTPILRYLIKNFLLTLPLIRDTTIQNSSGEEESTFWTKGIQPLLASFHTLELSHSMEIGSESAGLPTMIYSDYLARAVERFISAGLKLSYGTVSNESTNKNNLDNFNLSTPPSSPTTTTGINIDPFLGNIVRTNSHTSTIKSEKKVSTETDVEKDTENSETTSITAAPKLPSKASRFNFGFLRNRLTPAPLSPSLISPPPTIPLPELPDPNPITSTSPQLPPPLITGSSDSSGNSNSNGNLDRFSISSSEDGSTLSHAGQVSSSWFSWIPSAITGHTTVTSTSPPDVVEEKVEEIDAKRAVEEKEDRSTIGKVDDQLKATSSATTNGHHESRVDNARLSTISTTSSSSTTPSTPPPFLRSRTFKSHSPTSIDSSPPLLDSSFAASRRVPSVILPNGMNLNTSNSKKYVEKSGVPWPFGSRTSVWKDIDVNSLKWGGFEVDIVGVRSGFLSAPEFIIRVRRPGRLDETVLRTQAQFVKYCKVLDKDFPDAHVKRIPTTINPKDDVELSAQSIPSDTRRRTTSDSGLMKKLPAIVETPKAESRPESPISTSSSSSRSPTPTATPATTNLPSAFVRQLQAQSSLSRKDSGKKLRSNSPAPSAGGGLQRTYSIVGEQKGLSSAELSKQLSPFIDSKQPYDSQRRALRNWLRDALSIKHVGHHEETGEFLLLGSIIPKKIDTREALNRKAIDDARRLARLSVASKAKDKLSSLHTHWSEVEKEFIYENGFTTLSDILRNTATIDTLPIRYTKAIDWLQMGLAETIYELFVASEASETTFKKLKAFHQAFPYFLVRQAFKLPTKNMTKVLQDILISRPFGGKSLLQKLISIFLDDDPLQLNEKLRISQSRIGSQLITSKLDSFVYSTEEKKEMYRKLAVGNQCELVTAILLRVEKSSIPLPSPEVHRIRQAHASYHSFTQTTTQRSSSTDSNDSGVELMLELKNYLQLKCQERDSGLIRNLLGEVSTGLALEELGGPFMELIKRIHKVGNAGQAILKMEEGLDQFIVVIEALRSRLHDSTKSIRIISNLLSRQQAALYNFIHSIHRGDTLVEEFLSWSWTASVLLNRGFAQSIDLEKVLPRDLEAKQRLMKEVEGLVNYHKLKRIRQYQNACRVLSGDVDGDSVVIVKGDGQGRSVVTASIEKRSEMPRLKEIPLLCLEAFKNQIQKIFAV